MKALLIPTHAPISEIEGDTYRDLAADADIQWPERVNTQNLHDHDSVMMVDEDGHGKGLALNPRAMTLSGYPGPIVGNVVILSEAMGSDGINFVSISGKALAWAKDRVG